jgi:hypothetical protein
MQELSINQCKQIMTRFPHFELSYETVSHKKVPPPKYNVCIAIPQSKKYYLWFTFLRDQDVCYLMELTREKKIGRIFLLSLSFDFSLSNQDTPRFALGTVLYGSMNENHFIIEDLFHYNGIPMGTCNWSHKLGFLFDMMSQIAKLPIKPSNHKTPHTIIAMPHMWGMQSDFSVDVLTVLYPVHHYQYRALNEICPNLNVFTESVIHKNSSSDSRKTQNAITHIQKHSPDFSKPQYNTRSVFKVCADIQFDIYHLYAYGRNCEPIYYDVAYIPNYKNSVFMNRLFRNIKENANLDLIEESDDEDDFQNTNYDKYVDLNKELYIECVFNKKFKRWVPSCVVDPRNPNSKVVHISKLVKHYTN